MKHLFLIDPIEKLNPKKDSTLMLATTFKEAGHDVELLLEPNFYYSNRSEHKFNCRGFNATVDSETHYLKDFSLLPEQSSVLSTGDVLHMRIDPPFDARYLRYLWMLRGLQSKGIRVVNSPDGILKYNEKIYAYMQESSLPSFVGSSWNEFSEFCSEIQKKYSEVVLKPLDLFQGMGIEKISISDPNLKNKFQQKVLEANGPIVAQPFFKEISQGEIRAIYFKGQELGSILKVPAPGNFLSNIVQGASFKEASLDQSTHLLCQKIAKELAMDGVDWIAFDIMAGHISEINITCPGLLVEVSHAAQKNLAAEIVRLL